MINEERIERFKKYTEEYEKEENTLLNEGLISFFEEYPEMKEFGWIQDLEYNDENDDHFTGSADPSCLIINGHRLEGDIYYRDNENSKYTFPEWHKKAAQDISDFLNIFKYSSLIDIFGEGSEVIVTPKGNRVNYDY